MKDKTREYLLAEEGRVKSSIEEERMFLKMAIRLEFQNEMDHRRAKLKLMENTLTIIQYSLKMVEADENHD